VLTLGDRRKASRKRAVGTREHIIAHLTGTHELFDPGGMASTRLAAAVGYPGSSVAFAQLLSGMERSGLIERDVRGKRTYRIRLGPAAAETARVSGLGGVLGPGAEAGMAGFDYDELARRLLAQIVRRLAGAEPALADAGAGSGAGAEGALAGTGGDTEPALAGTGAEPALAGTGAEPALAGTGGDAGSAALREMLADLETELASVRTGHGKIAEENARLREQLRIAEQSLALARESLRRRSALEEARPVGA
jgi:hypothetical protein